jgi:hypothetical protein
MWLPVSCDGLRNLPRIFIELGKPARWSHQKIHWYHPNSANREISVVSPAGHKELGSLSLKVIAVIGGKGHHISLPFCAVIPA